MKSMTAFLGSSLLCIAAGGALASETGRFEWSPSALTTAEGVVATHERIETHAARYCRAHLRGTRGLSLQARCERSVAEEIVERIGDRRLSAYAASGKTDGALTASR
jgi:UrcA family protein